MRKTLQGVALLSVFILFGAVLPGNNAIAQVTEQWVARYNGPGNSYDIATSIVVDSSGNTYVTGYSLGVGTGRYDYATVKYDSAGVEQ